MKGYIAGALALAAGSAVVAQVFDDGIDGCLNIEGRAHFQYDDGTISADPIIPLNFTADGEGCYVSHGGGTAGDYYDLLNSRSAAAELAQAAAGYSAEKWEEVYVAQAERGAANPFDMLEASFDQYGRISFQDEAGDEIKQGDGVPVLMSGVFSDAIHHVHAGDETHPDGAQVDTPELGTAIVAVRSAQGPLAVYEMPARQFVPGGN